LMLAKIARQTPLTAPNKSGKSVEDSLARCDFPCKA
jgi:hypothetical protein